VIVFDDGQDRSVIGRLDPRLRLLVAAAFAGVLCVCHSPIVLFVGLVLATATLLLADMVNARTLRRLAAVNLFLLLLAATMPLSCPGEAVWQIGPWRWSDEGLRRAGLIALRANAVMIAFFALVGTMEPAHIGVALDRLATPRKLTHVFLFMVRYIEVIHQEYHRLDNAMRVRGFRPGLDRHTLRTMGHLVGMLLVRSIDRAERIAAAMKCRGFRGRFYVLTPMPLAWPDLVFGACAVMGLALLGILQWTPVIR